MIQIFDNFYLTADTYNFTLTEKITRKKIDKLTKKETDEDITQEINYYFPTLPACLNACLDMAAKRGIKNEEITTLKQLIETYAINIKKLTQFELK